MVKIGLNFAAKGKNWLKIIATKHRISSGTGHQRKFFGISVVNHWDSWHYQPKRVVKEHSTLSNRSEILNWEWVLSLLVRSPP